MTSIFQTVFQVFNSNPVIKHLLAASFLFMCSITFVRAFLAICKPSETSEQAEAQSFTYQLNGEDFKL